MNDAARPAPEIDQPDSQVTTHYATFDVEEYEPVSSAVVATVARAAGVPTHELQELHGYLEPCALDQLFESLGEGSPTTGEFVFEYAGFEVTVRSCGQIVVRSPGVERP